MNEKMKELFIFVAIGCAGVVGMEIAMLVATYMIEGPTPEFVDHMMAVIASFFWAMFWGAIFYYIFKKKNLANMKMEKRQKIITNQMYIITTLIVLVTMLLVVFIIKQVREGIIFSGAFVFALLFWETGCVLADKVFQKDMEENVKKVKGKK